MHLTLTYCSKPNSKGRNRHILVFLFYFQLTKGTFTLTFNISTYCRWYKFICFFWFGNLKLWDKFEYKLYYIKLL